MKQNKESIGNNTKKKDKYSFTPKHIQPKNKEQIYIEIGENLMTVLIIGILVALFTILISSLASAATQTANSTNQISVSVIRMGSDLILDYDGNALHYNLTDNFSGNYKFNYTYTYPYNITIDNNTNNMSFQQINNYNNDSMCEDAAQKTIERINNLEKKCTDDIVTNCKIELLSINDLAVGLNGSLAMCQANLSYSQGMISMKDEKIKDANDAMSQQLLVISALALIIVLLALFAKGGFNFANVNKALHR